MKRKNDMCLRCPACFKPTRDGLTANGGGYVEVEIDGQIQVICRPGEAGAGRKCRMDRYDYYCLASIRGRKIARGADYTGLTPKWCPRVTGEYPYPVKAPEANRKKCLDCGCSTEGEGKLAKYCESCRRKRISEAAKKRKLSKIGSSAYSRKCKKRKAGGADK